MNIKKMAAKLIKLANQRKMSLNPSSNGNGFQCFGSDYKCKNFQREAHEILTEFPTTYQNKPVVAMFTSSADSQNGSAYVNICAVQREKVTADNVFTNDTPKQ